MPTFITKDGVSSTPPAADPLRRNGGPRPGAGRPKTDAPKRVSRSISMLPSEWAAIDGYAAQEGLTRSAAVARLISLGTI